MEITLHGLADALIMPQRVAHASKRALIIGITKTAKKVKIAQKEHMQTIFDRPKKWTVNSVYSLGATADRLQGRVWLKDLKDGVSGTPAAVYLLPQITGGPRKHKKVEIGLISLGLLRPTEFLVPSSNANRDIHGNISAREISDMVNYFRNSGTRGEQNDQISRSSERSSRRTTKQYFLRRTARGGKIFRHVGAGAGRRQPVFSVTGQPRYNKKYYFFELSQTVIDENLQQEIADRYEIEIAR